MKPWPIMATFSICLGFGIIRFRRKRRVYKKQHCRYFQCSSKDPELLLYRIGEPSANGSTGPTKNMGGLAAILFTSAPARSPPGPVNCRHSNSLRSDLHGTRIAAQRSKSGVEARPGSQPRVKGPKNMPPPKTVLLVLLISASITSLAPLSTSPLLGV